MVTEPESAAVVPPLLSNTAPEEPELEAGVPADPIDTVPELLDVLLPEVKTTAPPTPALAVD